MSSKYFSLIRFLLLLAAVFLLADAAIHFSGLRLFKAAAVWPTDSVMVIKFLMCLWASATLFISLLLFKLQANLSKYIDIIKIIAFYSIIHAAILIYFSFINWPQIVAVKSFYLHPFYAWQLRLEASGLLFFSLVFFYGYYKK